MDRDEYKKFCDLIYETADTINTSKVILTSQWITIAEDLRQAAGFASREGNRLFQLELADIRNKMADATRKVNK